MLIVSFLYKKKINPSYRGVGVRDSCCASNSKSKSISMSLSSSFISDVTLSKINKKTTLSHEARELEGRATIHKRDVSRGDDGALGHRIVSTDRSKDVLWGGLVEQIRVVAWVEPVVWASHAPFVLLKELILFCSGTFDVLSPPGTGILEEA